MCNFFPSITLVLHYSILWDPLYSVVYFNLQLFFIQSPIFFHSFYTLLSTSSYCGFWFKWFLCKVLTLSPCSRYILNISSFDLLNNKKIVIWIYIHVSMHINIFNFLANFIIYQNLINYTYTFFSVPGVINVFR